MRSVVNNYTSRPVGAFVLIDKEYPNSNITYSLVLTEEVVSISQPNADVFSVNYVGKSSRDVSRELNNSPFPIEVRSLVNIKQLKAGELLASGTEIPYSFDTQDVTSDGKGAIVRAARYMSTYKRLSAIKLSLPSFNGPNLPWWPRVTNGEFTQLYNSKIWTFSVPEYSNQNWSKTWGRPFRDVEGELARFRNSNTIKLSKAPVLWRGNNIVLATPGDAGVLPSKIIDGVDEQNGILYLKPGTVISKDVAVYYTYYESNYLYNELNINSHFTHNPSLLNSFVLFFARPTKSSTGASRQRGIYHITAESLEAAIGAIPPDPDVGFENAPVALLGAISIRPSIDKADLSVVDTRSYGGGLISDSMGRTVEDKMVRSKLFFDIARKDGIPYGGSAAVLLDLPPELKEVMSIDEIKVRAKKFLAAGVYPVMRFSEEDYYSQFEISEHNTDISLIDYRLQNVIDTDNDVFGSSTSLAYWIDDDLSLPESGIYGKYAPTDLRDGPIGTGDASFEQSYKIDYLTTASSQNIAVTEVSKDDYYLTIDQGKSYYIPYLRSSATPIFSYEERYDDTEWKRKTVRDESEVNQFELAAGKLRISADYGKKHVRNFTGFVGAPLADVSGEFWGNLASRCTAIFKDIESLTTGDYGVTAYEVPDVSSTDIALKGGHIVPGVDPLYEPWLKNYKTCVDKNFYSGDTRIGSAALYNYKATDYDMSVATQHAYDSISYGAFPRKYILDSNSTIHVPDSDGFATVYSSSTSVWGANYEAIKDLIAYSKYSTYRSNELALSGLTNSPSIKVPNGAASWISYEGDSYAQYAHSGCLQIANRIHFCKNIGGKGWYGGDTSEPRNLPSQAYNAGLSDIISPTFNSNIKGSEKIDAENLLLTGYSTSEVATSENTLYQRAMYTEAFAAFYATFPCPPSGEHTKEDVFVPVSGNPRNIAMSGIAMCNETLLTGHFYNPTYFGDTLEDTWLTKYNRLSKLGATYSQSITKAFDSLYYGNKEWAGYNLYEAKTAPYYDSSSNPNNEYQSDTCPDGNITWYDGVTRTFEESLRYSLSGFYTNMTGMAPYVEVGAKKGGILLPGYIDLVRSYLWLPTHYAKGDVLFTEATNTHLAWADFSSLVNTFEIGMAAAVKGSFGEDGILKEGGSFKGESGPYSGSVPSSLFKACGDAISYYSAAGDKSGEYKWLAIANGLFNTSERLHNLAGGYPYNATHGLTNIAGDVGSAPLDGYLYLLGSWTGSFTSAEFNAMTGGTEGRF